MASTLREWLASLELEHLTAVFEENQVGLRDLPLLSEEDLKELGLALGPRKRIFNAIAEFSPGNRARDAEGRGPDGPPAITAERRQLTVMFCDLVGSTQLSRRMDPEAYRDVLGTYRAAVSGAIRRYDGHIATYMGDGILVYFGYPQAHEDDPERAVRSGLDIVESIHSLRSSANIELQVRIGIATGLVVAGDIVVDGASEERAVIGDTPNLAARLQGIADPNAVVLSDATRRLVKERFVLEALEPQVLKGLEEPVPAYRAIAVEQASRIEALAARGLADMTGRESELALLQQRWERASLGEGQVLLLGGEPGIGKSRVARELRERIGVEPGAVLHYQCSPYHTDSAFHPFIDQLQRTAGFDREDSPQARRKKLQDFADRWLPEVKQAVPLLAALLSLPLDLDTALALTPQRQKAETIGVLVRLLDRLVTRGPILMIFEDAHWIDPSSRELLDAIIDRIQTLRILCLITFRPEFSPPWTGLGHVTTHTLNRLGRYEVARIVEGITAGKALPAEVLAQILERTDGVPLFVEELTKTILEAGILTEADGCFVLAGGLPTSAIPATLHDSLLARLDRLAPVKEVAQTAACLGREFTLELLASVLPMQRTALEDALEQLVGAELIFRRGTGEFASFTFKHALVQDAAYESLLVGTRRHLHARIAQVLEEQFSETAASEPERLAQHYTAADNIEKAVLHWLAAGRKALGASNLLEATSHLTKALGLTAKIADPIDQAERELEVRTALGAATMAIHGWPAREMRDVVEPACVLFEQGRGSSDAFMNLWNLWVHHGCRAEHREGLAVVERMLKHSLARNDPVLSLVSSFTAAMANFWVGNYDEALAHESAALEIYEFERDKKLVWHYNHDPKNTLLSWAALRIWTLGYPDQARALSDEAVAHARRIGHPFNLCWTLGNSTLAYSNCGDFDKARGRNEELRRIAQDQELPFMDGYMAPGTMCIAAARNGHYQLAYDEGARAETVWLAIGGRFWSPLVRAYMAEACLHLDRAGKAQVLITGAIEQMEVTGELMLAEEIYRIAGLVHLENARDESEATSLFEKSFAYSKQHGTKSLELRTAVAQARMWLAQGKRRAAYDLLAPIFDWFTEGFDTVDLVEAKALLDQLN